MAALGGLGKLGRAVESKFFREESEEAVVKRRDWLSRQGTLEEEVAKQRASAIRMTSSEILSEVLAHRIKLTPRPLPEVRGVDEGIFRPENAENVFVPYNTRNLVDFGIGTRVSMGRSKWTQEQGASIFDTSAGAKMASTMPEGFEKKDVRTIRLARAGTTSPFWKILPELTAGRAFLWGTALALWGTALGMKTVCSSMGIESVADVNSKMKEFLSPSGAAMHDTLSPLKARVTKIDPEGPFARFTKEIKGFMGGGGERHV